METEPSQKLHPRPKRVKEESHLADEARKFQLGRFIPAAFERAVKMYEMQARLKAAKITAALQPSAR